MSTERQFHKNIDISCFENRLKYDVSQLEFQIADISLSGKLNWFKSCAFSITSHKCKNLEQLQTYAFIVDSSEFRCSKTHQEY